MNSSRRTKLKIVCATLLAIFSLTSAFTATIAWFTSIRAVNMNNDEFNIHSNHGIIQKVSVYNQSGDVPYVFNSTPAQVYRIDDEAVVNIQNNAPITIDSYSSLSEYPDATIMYLFELDPTAAALEEEYYIKAKTDTLDSTSAGANGTNGSLVYKGNDGYAVHPLVFDVDDETKAEMIASGMFDESDFGLNSMSSVIAFSTKTYASALTAVDGKYDLSNDFASVTSQQFVNPDVGAGETSFSYTTYSLDNYLRPSNSNATIPNYVAVVCHYNAPALQYVFNINLGNPVTDSEHIMFTVDWYFEIK